ncbi:hypothetical protein HBB16_18090 [Pseudonocardia sp. MCCB 268]|nr:hypothetical protein [Pseudonocardia cytotoxica]
MSQPNGIRATDLGQSAWRAAPRVRPPAGQRRVRRPRRQAGRRPATPRDGGPVLVYTRPRSPRSSTGRRGRVRRHGQ